MPELRTEAQIREALTSAHTIAVLGAHHDASRPAFYVPDYLRRHGYRILPVNPDFAGQTFWGEGVRETLAAIAEPVDIVDVFRRPEHLDAHLEDLLAMNPKPRLVWLQLGIRNDASRAPSPPLASTWCKTAAPSPITGAWGSARRRASRARHGGFREAEDSTKVTPQERVGIAWYWACPNTCQGGLAHRKVGHGAK